jgi:hypothetical protein
VSVIEVDGRKSSTAGRKNSMNKEEEGIANYYILIYIILYSSYYKL